MTRAEIDWLLGKKQQLSNSHEPKTRSAINKKIIIFDGLERPLLIPSGFIAAATTNSCAETANGSSFLAADSSAGQSEVRTNHEINQKNKF